MLNVFISPGFYKKCFDDKSKPIRSLRDYNEPGFHSVIELLLSSKTFISFISEMRLIIEYKKKTHKYGFADIFLLDNISGDNLLVLE
jgi:hypothetical protein